jgi:hypothetical protein
MVVRAIVANRNQLTQREWDEESSGIRGIRVSRA